MRKKRHLLIVVSALLILSCKQKGKQIPVEVKELPDYPSASGIEVLDNKIYVIGDDANNLLVFDTGLNIIDSIVLYPFIEKRIPKSTKADLEGITVLPGGKLLLTGSGSLAPYRNVAWLFDTASKQKDIVMLDTFYKRLLSYNINELNIEGLATIPGSIMLSSRGNKGYPKNHLIFTGEDFWRQQAQTKIDVALAGFNKDSSSFSGVSGMAYALKDDALIMTVSTEDTRNSLDDGAIGKSYLWIINNISSKKGMKAINPDKIIDLEKTDTRFKEHKIESVCILKETNKQLHLLLAADNDDGSSTLFKLVISKD